MSFRQATVLGDCLAQPFVLPSCALRRHVLLAGPTTCQPTPRRMSGTHITQRWALLAGAIACQSYCRLLSGDDVEPRRGSVTICSIAMSSLCFLCLECLFSDPIVASAGGVVSWLFLCAAVAGVIPSSVAPRKRP